MSGTGSSSDTASFYLVPLNSAARSLIRHEHNAPYVVDRHGERALFINFISRNDGFQQLRITLGRDRNRCDIVFPDSNSSNGIQREHCHLEYNQITGAVVLYDRSANRGTVVDDLDDGYIVPISQEYASVIISRGFNRNLYFGRKGYYQFKVVWSQGLDPLRSFLSAHPTQFGPQRRHDYDPARARYLEGEILGSGAFGLVRRAVNIHDGTPMAVKRFHNLEGRGHVMAIREINNMLKVQSNNRRKHENILHVLDIEYDKETYKWIEIFMPLMEGSVKPLVENGIAPCPDAQIGDMVLRQMAEALRYMARYDIVHRDVKPENILYQTMYDDSNNIYSYHFRLADFGLSSDTAEACTRAGTPLFMAPEVYSRGRQSPKTDIWSLFVTICWINDWGSFRSYDAEDPDDLLEKIMLMAEEDGAAGFRDMAVVNPQLRVSARSLVARLRDHEMQPLDDMAYGMANISLNGEEDSYVPAVTGDVRNRFRKANGGSASRHRQATMNGQSAIDQFTTAAEPTYDEQSYQTATLGQAYGRPRKVRESQDYEDAGGYNGAEEVQQEEEEAGDDGGYGHSYGIVH